MLCFLFKNISSPLNITKLTPEQTVFLQNVLDDIIQDNPECADLLNSLKNDIKMNESQYAISENTSKETDLIKEGKTEQEVGELQKETLPSPDPKERSKSLKLYRKIHRKKLSDPQKKDKAIEALNTQIEKDPDCIELRALRTSLTGNFEDIYDVFQDTSAIIDEWDKLKDNFDPDTQEGQKLINLGRAFAEKCARFEKSAGICCTTQHPSSLNRPIFSNIRMPLEEYDKQTDGTKRKASIKEFFDKIVVQNRSVTANFTIEKQLTVINEDQFNRINSFVSKVLGKNIKTICSYAKDTELEILAHLLSNTNHDISTDQSEDQQELQATLFMDFSGVKNLTLDDCKKFLKKCNTNGKSNSLGIALERLSELRNARISDITTTQTIKEFLADDNLPSLDTPHILSRFYYAQKAKQDLKGLDFIAKGNWDQGLETLEKEIFNNTNSDKRFIALKTLFENEGSPLRLSDLNDDQKKKLSDTLNNWTINHPDDAKLSNRWKK